MTTCPTFDFKSYDIRFLTPERRAELVAAVASGDAYVVGGHSATLQGDVGTRLTEFSSPSSVERG
jgi:hypothetical protein